MKWYTTEPSIDTPVLARLKDGSFHILQINGFAKTYDSNSHWVEVFTEDSGYYLSNYILGWTYLKEVEEDFSNSIIIF